MASSVSSDYGRYALFYIQGPAQLGVTVSLLPTLRMTTWKPGLKLQILRPLVSSVVWIRQHTA